MEYCLYRMGVRSYVPDGGNIRCGSNKAPGSASKTARRMCAVLRRPPSSCESRDPKGLYGKARLGVIGDMTGISSPYEEPENLELLIDTDRLTLDESVELIIQFLVDSGIAIRVEPKEKLRHRGG